MGGAFLRREGLHEVHLEQLREEVQEAATEGLRAKGRRRGLSPEEKELRALRKELARKEKALAEAAALLVLRGKVQAFFSGEEEGDTDDEEHERPTPRARNQAAHPCATVLRTVAGALQRQELLHASQNTCLSSTRDLCSVARMSLSLRPRFWVVAVACLAGCGPSGQSYPIDAVVEDSAGFLTMEPGDPLCDLHVLASEETYEVRSLQTTVIGPISGSGTTYNLIVPFELVVDANGDGAVGTGDTLRLYEDVDGNTHDASSAGLSYEVTLTANPASPDRMVLFQEGEWLAN